MSIRVRNWRDQAPYVGHISALVWTLYQSHDKDETSPPDINRLHGINSFVKHGLQGHQHSDHHQHDNIEQLYFVLRGRGQLLIGDDKVDVRDGTAVYMPVNVPHQAFNDGEGWMEHLIVSCPLDEIRVGTPAVRDWRDVHPEVVEGGTVSWPLLRREEEASAGEGGVLQRVHSVTRYAVQGRGETAWRQLDGIELVHYVLGGFGSIEDGQGNRQAITEGSAAHVLPGENHKFSNQGEGWLEFVTFAVEVGEIDAKDETDDDSDSEESAENAAEHHGVEVATATAVVSEVDWDEADAVETDEEIEEAEDDDVEDEAGEAPSDAIEVELVEEAEVVAEDGDDGSEEVEAEAEEVVAAAEEGDDVAEDEEQSAAVDEIDEEAEEAVAAAEEGDDGSEEIEAEADEAEEDTDEDSVDVSDVAEDTNDAGGPAENGSDGAVYSADEGDGEDDSSVDDDDIDLEDDDAEFNIEDEDEFAAEDETGDEDEDSPYTDGR